MKQDILIVDENQNELLNRFCSAATHVSKLENNYVCARFEPGAHHEMPQLPATRISGQIYILLTHGEIIIDQNFEQRHVEAGMMINIFDNNVFSITSPDWNAVGAYFLFMSQNFLHNVNISLTAFDTNLLKERKRGLMKFAGEDLTMISRYMEMLAMNADYNVKSTLCRYVASSLVSALFYQILLMLYRIQEESNDQESDKVSASAATVRRSSYVPEFIKLVHLHYMKERSVNFYASKLFISPKYLSLLVKEATGRSASRWIDDLVIMEAKNLLRFSGKNIQQVAYTLNFSNQSSFGKYFKHLTGMSPTEYQKQ